MQSQRVKRLNHATDRVVNQQTDYVVEVLERGLKKAIGFLSLDTTSVPGAAAGLLKIETDAGDFYVPVYSTLAAATSGTSPPADDDEVTDMMMGGEPPFTTTYETFKTGSDTTKETWTDVGSIVRLSVDYTYTLSVIQTSVRKVFDNLGVLVAMSTSTYNALDPADIVTVRNL
jgi:hypothetical protein